MSRRPIESRKLLYFVTTVEMGSISRAADKLSLAQPALSQAITGLEHDIGKTLLIRASSGVSPTDAGKMLYRHAVGVLRQLEVALDEVKNFGGDPHGKVILGMPMSVTGLIAPRILRRVAAEYPFIRLTFLTAPSHLVDELVFKSSYDLGVVTTESVMRGLQVTPLVEEAIAMILPPEPGASLIGEITLQDAIRYPIMMPPPPNNIRMLFESSLEEAGLRANFSVDCDAPQLLRELVHAGYGASVLTWASMHPEGVKEPTPVRLISAAGFKRQLYVAHSELRPLSQAAIIVRQVLIEEVQMLIVKGGWPTATSLVPS